MPLIGIVISSSEHLKYTDCIMRFVQFNASLESMHFKSVQYLTWIWRIIKPSMFKTTWNILFNFFPGEFDIPRYSFPSAVQIAFYRLVLPLTMFSLLWMISCFVFVGLECNAIRTNRVESRISIKLPWRKLRKRNDTRFTLWCSQTMLTNSIALTRSLLPFSFSATMLRFVGGV